MDQERQKRGLVISDLHLLAGRSSVAQSLASIVKAEAYDAIVLNGDIFDFAWSVLPPHAAFAKASDLLEELIVEHKTCAIHYVLGNHDAVQEFQLCLEKLAGQYKNFFVHDIGCRLGPHYFTHGDLQLSRTRRPNKRHCYPRWMHFYYSSAPVMKLSRLMIDTQALTPWLRRIYDLVGSQTDIATVRHVYFGHIHRTFRNVNYRGILFHNSGCGIKQFSFNPIPFEWSDNE